MGKILIVDNEDDFVEILDFRLERSGHAVINAVSGAEAIEKAEKERPDLVLLDLGLPDIQGGEVCKRLKIGDKTKNIPVILISASELGIMKDIQKDCGADGVIAKPFNAEEFLKIVDKMLK